jgi:hypothetical protein
MVAEGAGVHSVGLALVGDCPANMEVGYVTESLSAGWRELRDVFDPLGVEDDGNRETERHLLSEDLDGDGDIDLLVGVWNLADERATLGWFERGPEMSFTLHRLELSALHIFDLQIIELNGDDRPDILISHSNGVDVYDNDGAASPEFVRRPFDETEPLLCTSTVAGDIDGDGDNDLACAGPWDDNRLRWFRNEGGESPQFTAHAIEDLQHGFTDIQLADFNGDGFTDIVSAAWVGHHHNWYAGSGEALPTFERHIIDVGGTADGFFWDEPFTSTLVDFDGDADLDLISSSNRSASDRSLIWYENDGLEPMGVTQIEVPDMHLGWVAVRAGDVDGDGDVDLLAAQNIEGGFGWYEQVGGPDSFTRHPLGSSTESFIAKDLVDIDGDGDLDVLTLPFGERGLNIWENNLENDPSSIAEPGEDYEEISGSFSFSPNERETNLEVTLVDDGTPEADEQFLVVLDVSAETGRETRRIVVTIVDDD